MEAVISGIISRIDTIATNNNISVTEAMKKCGYKDLVVNMRRGSMPSVDKLLKIAEYFGVDIRWLLTGEGNMQLSPSETKVISENENSISLSLDEELLIDNFRCLSRSEQKRLFIDISELANKEKIKQKELRVKLPHLLQVYSHSPPMSEPHATPNGDNKTPTA